MTKIGLFCCIFICQLFCNYGMILPFLRHGYLEDIICCVPSEWESLMYLDYGTVFIDNNGGTAFSYINGSVRAAYSFTKKKSFFELKGVEQSPLIPKPVQYDTTILYDFYNGLMYTLSTTGDCQKDQLGNMTRQCIPGSAKLVSSASIGANDLPVLTYRFIIMSDIQWEITATVYISDVHPFEPRQCIPIQITYFTPSINPDSGSYYSLEVTDVSNVNSSSIFDIRKQCS